LSVRVASFNDVTACITLGAKTLSRSKVNGSVCEMSARRVLLRAINDKSFNLWIAEHEGVIVGFLLAIKEQHWFSKDKYATDICFVLNDGHGNYAASMIKRFIKWAKEDPKVTDIMLGISSGLDQDGRTGRMYQNLGFTPVGGIYSLLEK